MVFSSISFVFFIFPLFLIADSLARYFGNSIWRNTVLLAVSLLFYTWGESINLVLLLAMGFLNYYGGRRILQSSRPKLVTGLLVTFNLLSLIIFKYSAWLVSLFYSPAQDWRISLPLGISFFTFHAISYILDVYRKDIEPARTGLNFMTYFCMFPHLVAGPIVRYRQVQNELDKRADSRDLFNFGMYRFLLGFNKKIIIANSVAPLADAAFLSTQAGSFGDVWLGIAAYAVQIYFDFSAYSDMAIGLAAMAGFRFEENFKRPYSATSVRDFWRRWHISLSSWLRDYLYISLGGSRAGEARTLLNLVIVFFLCGLWHGASFTFVLWGLWHGLFLIIERLGLGRLLDKAPVLLGRVYTLVVVLTGWVFFRAISAGQAFDYIGTMFSPNLEAVTLTYFTKGVLGLAAGVFLCLLPDRLLPGPDCHKPQAFTWPWFLLQAMMFFPAVFLLVGGSRNPFIYFNF